MLLSINHQTSYQYEHMTLKSVQYIRMTPKVMPHQKVIEWQLMLPKIGYYQADGFGNQWTTLTRNQPHDNLLIQAQGKVEINEETKYLLPDRISPYVYVSHTELTKPSDAIKAFTFEFFGLSEESAIPKNHTYKLSDLQDFAAKLLEHMPYTPNATMAQTTASEAFEQQLGVCQDHTHVMLSCMRLLGIPARYVSGYLYTNEKNHIQTHAWAEVLVNSQWHTFDVSNQLFTPTCHVYVAFGRDYHDTAPVRGVRQGGGIETMQSQVFVERLS